MLAVLAHHLCAALVPFNVDFAFWTPFDRRVVFLVLVKGAGGGQEGRGVNVTTLRGILKVGTDIVLQPTVDS